MLVPDTPEVSGEPGEPGALERVIGGEGIKTQWQHLWQKESTTLPRDLTATEIFDGALAGDTLALYTDGITESFNDAGEEFGEQRLIDALRENREGSPQSALDSIVAEVRRFSAREQHDDITLIVARGKE